MVAIVERSITKANELASLYLSQIDAVSQTQERVIAARNNVLTAERAEEQAEAEAILPALKLGKDGPIDGANETVRKHQITQYLALDGWYQQSVRDLDQAKTDLVNAEAALQEAVNRLTAYKYLIQAATAEMSLLAAHND